MNFKNIFRLELKVISIIDESSDHFKAISRAEPTSLKGFQGGVRVEPGGAEGQVPADGCTEAGSSGGERREQTGASGGIKPPESRRILLQPAEVQQVEEN